MNLSSNNSYLPKIKELPNKSKASPILFKAINPEDSDKNDSRNSQTTDSLACRPSIIHFNDYEPGQIYSRQLSIVNTGSNFVNFRFGKFEESRYDLFNLEFRNTGRLAAGLSVPFKLKFFPNSRENFETFLMLNTKQRAIRIPIVCRYIRSDIQIEARQVDFGKTIQGEQKVVAVDICNRGGKATKVFVRDEAGQFLMKNVKFYRNIIDRMNVSRPNPRQEEEARAIQKEVRT